MPTKVWSYLYFLVGLWFAAPGLCAPTFHGLGSEAETGLRAIVPRGVSADGRAVVGYAAGARGPEAFLWTPETGVRGLGDLAGGDFWSSAYAVSADGAVVVGEATSAEGIEAFVWTSDGGMVGLGDLPGGVFESRALDVSADGGVVVGAGVSGLGEGDDEAFRWTKLEGMVGLGKPFAKRWSSATSVSDDGSTVAGIADYEAFRWSESSSFEPLGGFPGSSRVFTQAFGISGDGSVVVGNAVSPRGVEAFRWTDEGGFFGLGDFPGSTFSSFALGVSADGQVIVGTGRAEDGSRALLWTAADGIRRIDEVLKTDLAIDARDWTLNGAVSVSADGTTIVGGGTNPHGEGEAWILAMPPRCPAALDPDCSEAASGKVVIRNRGHRLRWQAAGFTTGDVSAEGASVCLYVDGAPAGGQLTPDQLDLGDELGVGSLDLLVRGARYGTPTFPLREGAVLSLELHDETGVCVSSSFDTPPVDTRDRYEAKTR